jgi:hypothetical protein
MASDRYLRLLPTISKWIQATLDLHAGNAKPVVSFGFPRLPRYFSEQLMSTTNVVVTDRLPVPPLSKWGLSEFTSFVTQPMSGITYLDTYFLLTSAAADESAHFHELVHVIQWQMIGPREFLLQYAAGLARHGYLGSPLEKMAYAHQRRFDADSPSYSVEAEVRKQLVALLDE